MYNLDIANNLHFKIVVSRKPTPISIDAHEIVAR